VSNVLRLFAGVLVIASLTACNRTEPTQASAAGAPAGEAAPAASPADSAATAPADTRASALTMDKVRAFVRALENLGKINETDAASGDPASEQQSEESREQYAARLAANAKVRGAIEDAGMSTEEFAYLSEMLPAAMIVDTSMAAGQMKAVPEGTDPAAAEFVKRNRKEVGALVGGVLGGQ
jgi:hypothetical protein